MAREEEIKKESKNRYPCIKGLPQTSANQEIFIAGAKWADKTMIEKACDWIQMNAMKYVNSIGGCMYFDVIDFTKDFKKAMEL